jgi:hypothetical protein
MNIHGYKKHRKEMRLMLLEEEKKRGQIIKVNRLRNSIVDCNKIIKKMQKDNRRRKSK